jgi:hypothetical protein
MAGPSDGRVCICMRGHQRRSMFITFHLHAIAFESETISRHGMREQCNVVLCISKQVVVSSLNLTSHLMGCRLDGEFQGGGA